MIFVFIISVSYCCVVVFGSIVWMVYVCLLNRMCIEDRMLGMYGIFMWVVILLCLVFVVVNLCFDSGIIFVGRFFC